MEQGISAASESRRSVIRISDHVTLAQSTKICFWHKAGVQ